MTDEITDAIRGLLERGVAAQKADRLDDAEAAYREVLTQDPDNADAFHLLGLVSARRGNVTAALDLIGRAIQLRPDMPMFHFNLAQALLRLGKNHEAVPPLRRATELAPDYAAAHAALGGVYESLADSAAAEQQYRRLIELQPQSANGYLLLANLQQRYWRLTDAVANYRMALQRAPEQSTAASNLAMALKLQGKYDEAIAIWRRILQRDPTFRHASVCLAETLDSGGEYDEALAVYTAAIQVRPDAGIEIRRAIELPSVPVSTEQIAAVRKRVLDQLHDLQRRQIRLTDPLAEVGATMFCLAYQGRDNRDIVEALANLYLSACPGLGFVAPHCRAPQSRGGRRIRLGLVSTYFHAHTIGRLNHGLVCNLDRSRFEVFLFYTPHAAPPTYNDVLRSDFLRVPEHAIEMPSDLGRARETIAAAELDLLYYTDIGMAPFTYFLAFSRLAPVQCVTWGHPDTTGIPAIDYFLSCDAMEPADGETHYTERLVRLPGTTLFYPRPAVPAAPKSRVALGLPEKGPLLVCPQSLFKFHPDFDRALVDMLRQEQRATLALLDQHHPNNPELIRRALRAAGGQDILDRVTFVRALPHEDFLSFLMAADVMLDTFHFSGGNTSLEGFAMGTPIVTWPGQFMRGRHTHGFFRLMGIDDGTAANPADYIDRALAIATTPARREDISAKIKSRNGVLYEDRGAIRAIEDWIASVAI